MLCTRNPVSLPQLANIEIPDATSTYQPVSHIVLARRVKHAFTRSTGLHLEDERYGTSKAGKRMFGALRFAPLDYEGNPDRSSPVALAVGLRNSYDKSVSAGVAVGGSVFVCDNLCFAGSGITYMRRHTRHVWHDLDRIITIAADGAKRKYRNLLDQLERMQQAPCSNDRAYRLIGLLRGRGVLMPSMMSPAYDAWDNPPHPDFDEPTFWRLYNACNHALKVSTADSMIDRHAKLHHLLLRNADVG